MGGGILEVGDDGLAYEIGDIAQRLSVRSGNLDAHSHLVGITLIAVILGEALVLQTIEGDDDVGDRLVGELLIRDRDRGVLYPVADSFEKFGAALEGVIEYC